ncbi:MAG: hypothetical protein AAB864_01305 [Patescibacteria group bacterium]
MEILTQVLGWIGTFLVLLAYFLVSNKKLSPTSAVYQLMNLVGVIGVGANVFYQHAWPALALQTIWGLIAVAALVKNR